MMRTWEQYIEDISLLTGMPIKYVKQMMKIFRLVVAHEIFECILDNSPVYESYCIGIGKLSVEYDQQSDDWNSKIELSIPMKKLLNQSLDENKSPLEGEINKALTKKIVDTAKRLLLDDDDDCCDFIVDSKEDKQ